jgi:WD40 repeat protein
MIRPDASEAQELHRADQAVYALAGAGGTIHAACADGRILTWRSSDPSRIQLTAQVPAPVFALALLSDGAFAAGTSMGELFLLDLESRAATLRLRAHARAIHAIAGLSEGRIATAGADGVLRIWTRGSAGWSLLRDVPLSDAKLRGLAVSSDGQWLAVACGDGPVRMLDTLLFNESRTFDGHAGGALSVLFHPEKPVLLSGGKDGHLRAWNLKHDQGQLPALPAHRSSIYALAAAPDGALLATASRDKTVKLWDALTMVHRATLDRGRQGHAHSVNAAAWIEAGLFTAGDDRRLLRWMPPA